VLLAEIDRDDVNCHRNKRIWKNELLHIPPSNAEGCKARADLMLQPKTPLLALFALERLSPQGRTLDMSPVDMAKTALLCATNKTLMEFAPSEDNPSRRSCVVTVVSLMDAWTRLHFVRGGNPTKPPPCSVPRLHDTVLRWNALVAREGDDDGSRRAIERLPEGAASLDISNNQIILLGESLSPMGSLEKEDHVPSPEWQERARAAADAAVERTFLLFLMRYPVGVGQPLADGEPLRTRSNCRSRPLPLHPANTSSSGTRLSHHRR